MVAVSPLDGDISSLVMPWVDAEAMSIFLAHTSEMFKVEHIWEYVRENSFGNKSFDSLDDVEDLLCSSLVTLEQQPNIVRSLTSFDWFNTLHLSSN
jgi:hypothetical protein